MPYVLKPNKIFVKDPEGEGFLPQNVIADETAQDIIDRIDNYGDTAVAQVESSINTEIARAQQAVSSSQSAVDGIEAQKDAMIASIASIAGQGTDTTLTQSSVAADAKAVGDAIGDLRSAMNQDTIKETLFGSDLPGTTVSVTFDSNDNPATITHMSGGNTVRTDVFTWSENSVTEVRTSSSKRITITTNLTTLAKTVSNIEEVA